MKKFALIILCLPGLAEARVFEFTFTSEISTFVDPTQTFSGLEAPINGYFSLELPSLANVDYHATFGYGEVFSESFPALLDARVMGISYLDSHNLGGNIDLRTDGNGRIEDIRLGLYQDTPDVYIVNSYAGWGDASSIWYEATGTWSTDDAVIPSEVPLPVSAWLMGSLLLGLGGASVLNRRRTLQCET